MLEICPAANLLLILTAIVCHSLTIFGKLLRVFYFPFFGGGEWVSMLHFLHVRS